MRWVIPTILLIEPEDQPDVSALLQQLGLAVSVHHDIGSAEIALRAHGNTYELVLESDKIPELVEYFNHIEDTGRFQGQPFAMVSDNPLLRVQKLPWRDLTNLKRLGGFINAVKKARSA